MVFSGYNGKLYFKPINLLGLSSIAYLGSGLAYGYSNFGYIHPLVLSALIICCCLWFIFGVGYRGVELSLTLPRDQEFNLLMISLGALGLMIIYYIMLGPGYFSADKITKYQMAVKYDFFQIPIRSASILFFLTLLGREKRFLKIKRLFLTVLFIICILEISRQLLLFCGIGFILYIWQTRRVCLFPSGILGVFTIIFLGVFIVFIFKPLFYLVVLGTPFSGGFDHYSELTNWFRWLNYAETRNIDISYVQRNDLRYSFQSFFLPFSTEPSSTKVWFSEVLGDDRDGITYGYSGLLWVSNYFSGIYLIIPFGLLFLFFRFFSKGNAGAIKLCVSFTIAIVSYRFFRSEWVLVQKASLWVYLYPCFLMLLFSRVRFFGTPSGLDNVNYRDDE